MRRIRTAGLIIAGVALAGITLTADVRTEEKTHVSFGGALGKMVNLFGGRSAREGLVETIAIKGDRKMTTTTKTAQLVDLAEEKIYDIDLEHKSYTVMTFAQLRQQMEEARAKAKERIDKAQSEKGAGQPTEPQKKMAIDVSTKETGEKKQINGFDCHEVVTTVTMHEDGKTLEEAGGMVLTNDAWMTAPIAAMKEVQAFNRRFFESVSGTSMEEAGQQMATAMAMYPGLKDALGRVHTEGARGNGTPISTVLTVAAVQSPEQATEQASQEQDASSGGGLGGMLARRLMKKKEKEKEKQQEEQKGAETPGRSTIMTTMVDVLSVATDVPEDAVAIPAGFKEKK